ncbi:hypothetical protein FNF27_06376 [Cafeteria roenbergensis]|uniref:Uncharacterized protein n=1 Tax=Cafeteria roenbergensis TaxID=33653 RepID=A0A5A8E343_CAFRO|nr:hypothetical protein FNF27_06376 [Cafeteria roenbergensis]
MPLVVLTGGPCVGKSAVAAQLGGALEADGWRVVVVSDDSLRLPRHSLYASAGAEKQGRSAVIAAVERALSATTVVIVDAMNYIKGFRYQLWCTTKGGLGPSCVVHVAGSLAAAEAANAGRRGTGREYPAASIPAIWRRLEAPSEADRWELPLFTVDAGHGHSDEPAAEEADGASASAALAKAPPASSSAFARAPPASSSAFARAPPASSSAFARAPPASSSAFARAPPASSSAFARAPPAPGQAAPAGLELPTASSAGALTEGRGNNIAAALAFVGFLNAALQG